MLPTHRLLRSLIAVNAALFFLEFAMTIGYLMVTNSVEQETLGMQEPDVGAAEVFSCCAVVILVPAYVAGLVGLYLLRDWGRWLNLGVLIVIHSFSLLTSLFDISMTWGFPNAVANVEAVVGGIILGMVFFLRWHWSFPRAGRPANAFEVTRHECTGTE